MKMDKIKYSTEFRNVLEFCKKEENRFYLGEGNPNAEILIIGKECANCHSEENSVERNLTSWDRLVQSNAQIIPMKADTDCKIFESDNSLLPWRNQKFLIRKKGGAIGKDGTATTWYNYQKLIDFINGVKRTRVDNIDFHEYCFETELSQIPLSNSKLLTSDKEHLRKDGIERRLILFRQEFFKKIKVIIMACGNYPRDYGIDIQNVFNVEWVGKTNEMTKRGNWWNKHDGTSFGPRLLIHTRQFSNGITDELIENIANEVRIFFEKIK